LAVSGGSSGVRSTALQTFHLSGSILLCSPLDVQFTAVGAASFPFSSQLSGLLQRYSLQSFTGHFFPSFRVGTA
jgi:hypothetical protein